MDHKDIPSDKKQFLCTHCSGKVLVPKDLPPTTAPCPYCGGTITSPAGDGSGGDQPAAPVQDKIQSSPKPSSGPPPVPPPAVIAAMVQGAPPPPAAAKPAQAQAPPPPRPAAAPPPQAAPPAFAPPAFVPPPVSAAPAFSPPPREEPKVESRPAPQPAAKTQEPEPTETAPRQAAEKASEEKARKPARGKFPVALVSLLLLGGAALTYFVTREMNREIPPPTATPAGGMSPLDANYIRIGWQKDATKVLNGFLTAEEADGKLPFILNSQALAPIVREFYGDDVIDDSDTPIGAFSVYELSEEDRKRGLFMMTYDQPPQFDMREFFRPLASLEVQYGINEADILLSTVARAGNFAMEPLRVHAFFKKTPSGLKLDWETFAQTKYRTFRGFTELAEPGSTGIFRVFIVEDVPDRNRKETGTRTYRLSDPAHTDDTARVKVKENSDLGRTLAQLNWRGTEDGTPLTRTATVELAWSGNGGPPQLQLQRFICWEFLGLGGQEARSTAAAK